MKTHLYYLETEDQDRLFDFLNEYVSDGYIDYSLDESNGIVSIENLLLEDDDDMYNILIDEYDLIEDIDYSEIIDDNDYDDFYNDDDI